MFLTGPDGYRKTVDRQLDTLLPGDTIAYPLVWPDTLKPGDYSIAIKGGDGVTHQGSAHLSAALSGAEVLGATEGSGRPGQTPASSRSRPSGSKFPSWVLPIVAVAGVGGGVVIGRRGRRPRPPSDAGAGEQPLASR